MYIGQFAWWYQAFYFLISVWVEGRMMEVQFLRPDLSHFLLTFIDLFKCAPGKKNVSVNLNMWQEVELNEQLSGCIPERCHNFWLIWDDMRHDEHDERCSLLTVRAPCRSSESSWHCFITNSTPKKMSPRFSSSLWRGHGSLPGLRS